MKTILILLACLITVSAFAGDVDTVVTRISYQDTLTATIDTIDVSLYLDVWKCNYVTITVYTTAHSPDTIQVYAYAADGATFAKRSVQSFLETSSIDSQIVATTRALEYVVMDFMPSKIRLITPDGVANTVFVIGGKRWDVGQYKR